ncbi:MAG TPA: hypothetical protein PL048_25640, partial [Leptospiraceae bacterium]|nr:hypothetical protein [Leptospiraceae bacterium]
MPADAVQNPAEAGERKAVGNRNNPELGQAPPQIIKDRPFPLKTVGWHKQSLPDLKKVQHITDSTGDAFIHFGIGEEVLHLMKKPGLKDFD